MTRRSSRSGTILIIVAGISALLASLSITFLLRIREGAQSSELLTQETQARLMLHAACSYILECSRIGYGPARKDATRTAGTGIDGFVTTPSGALAHREAFGWIDVRESDGVGFSDPGQPGPRDQRGERIARTNGKWPDVGGVVICPMFRWMRPPYAISPLVAANPILATPDRQGDPRWGLPLLSNPDPMPAVPNGWPAAISDSAWGDFVTGDESPVMSSANQSWFRVHRLSAGTFIVTCGAGGTLGFKDWSEVKLTGAQRIPGAPGGEELFNGDPALFESIRTNELRTWYEVRWSAAVRPLDFRYEEAMWWGTWLQNAFAYRTYPVNGSQYTGWGRSNRFNPNPMGTLSYVQRLEARGDGPIKPDTGEALPW
jgi:hypothetical protein